MNTSKLDKWMIAYEKNLHAVLDKFPGEYAYGHEMVPGVVVKMRHAFENDSYNHDGRAIAATCKDFGIKHTRKAISEFLNALEPHEDKHVDIVMEIPMELTKGRDGWEAVSMIHIPGQLENSDLFDDYRPTHVRVMTGKTGRGGLSTTASEVTATSNGFKAVMDFHAPAPWERLGASPDKCTEKSVALLHRICLSKLKELRPELFEVREVLNAIEANGAMPEGERNSDKEPDASGADEDHDDAGRFLPVPADHYVGARV